MSLLEEPTHKFYWGKAPHDFLPPLGKNRIERMIQPGRQAFGPLKNIPSPILTASVFLLALCLACGGGGGDSVSSPTAPAILQDPSNQTVLLGQSVSFTGSATGSPAPSYQWRRNSLDIPGAQSSSYTLASTVKADHQATFGFIASNAAGSVSSKSAQLLLQWLAITAQPQPISVMEGEKALFSVVADAQPACTYQWRKNGLSIQNATTASWEFTALLADQGALLDCVLTNSVGNLSTNPVVLTVTPKPLPPSFTVQPKGGTASVGASFTFHCEALGSLPLHYAWKKNGALIPGAPDSNDFKLASLMLQDEGSYRVRVSNGLGSLDSDPAELIVTEADSAPSITRDLPESLSAIENNPVTFSLGYTAKPGATAAWFRNGQAVPASSQTLGDTWTSLNEETASYVFTPQMSNHGDRVHCVLSNHLGSATSHVCTLSVHPSSAPVFTSQPSNQTVLLGQSASFTVALSGVVDRLQWQRQIGSNWMDLAGAQSLNFTLAPVQAADDGALFRCAASNAAGSSYSRTASLAIASPLSLLAQPVGQSVNQGATVTKRSSLVQESPHLVNIRYDKTYSTASLVEVHTLFGQFYNDDYDFILQTWLTRNYQVYMHYVGVRNSIQGTGVGVYDIASTYGLTAKPKVKGIIYYSPNSYADLSDQVVSHEIGHSLMNFVQGSVLSTSTGHFPTSTTAFGIMGSQAPNTGNKLSKLADGNYKVESQSPFGGFNAYELYMLGMIPASEVPDQIVFPGQSGVYTPGTILTGPGTTVSISQIIAANGPRVPAYPNAQTSFRLAPIVLSRGRLLSAQEMAFMDFMAARGESKVPIEGNGAIYSYKRSFYVSTGGKGSLVTALH